MENAKQQPTQINVQIMDSAKDPIYANSMRVQHTRDEFVLDFMKFFPPTATLNARIITNPGHLKRMIAALQENLDRYEKTFGPVVIADSPMKEIGFSENK